MKHLESISLSEYFEKGNYSRYDAGSPTLNKIFANQKHIDIDLGNTITEVKNGFPAKVFHSSGGYSSDNLSLDLLKEFSEEDYLTISLPDFPAEELDLEESEIILYDKGEHSASVFMSESEIPLVQGNCQFRIKLEKFNSINLSSVGKVEWKFIHSGVGGTITIYIMGIRIINKDYQLPNIDVNTANDVLQMAYPLDGITQSNGFQYEGQTYQQPVLYFASNPIGVADPKPIDASMQILFNTGNLEGENIFSYYMRSESKAYITQTDLQGVPQYELDNKPQPQFGISKYTERIQEELDQYNQEGLDGQKMISLDRKFDPVYNRYIIFEFKWGDSTSLSIRNSVINDVGYSFNNIELESNKNYILSIQLEEGNVRATIDKYIASEYNYSENIFDSTLIVDEFQFPRYGGRVGWFASFSDPTTYVKSIVPSSLNFAEYKSRPMISDTPVEGAELFANTIENSDSFESLLYPSEESIQRDSSRTLSGESYKIEKQSVISNDFELSDANHTFIEFDIYYTNPYPSHLDIYLKCNNYISFEISPYLNRSEEWQHIKIDLSSTNIPILGIYNIEIKNSTESIYWIDNFHIWSRNIIWEGRSVTNEVWESYSPWTPFNNITNKTNNGILFPIKGKELQIRAKALSQNAWIAQGLKVIPKYAQLGRIVWPEESLNPLEETSTFITHEVGGQPTEIEFVGTLNSEFGENGIYEWNFGDGVIAFGKKTIHTYENSGTSYTVTLSVIDSSGRRASETRTIDIG